MIGKITAFLIFAGIGALLIGSQYHLYVKRWKKKYDTYPETMAQAWADCDTGNGYRWVVRLDLPGKPWAVDYTKDHGTSYHPEMYHMTQQDEHVRVYYWKIDDGKEYHAGDDKAEYYFHFAEEDRYEMQKVSERHTRIRFYIIGGVILLAGILILLM